jgi:2-oxoglutarate dehydrogenase E2 component (dihydrolipoamide succinyltransferase)
MANIVVPELGESVVEARVARWLKRQGDRVAAGEAVVQLETEKVDVEVSAERAGVIASIAHQEGDDVQIGELLGVIDESAAAGNGGGGAGASAAAPAPVSAPSPAPLQATTPAQEAPRGAPAGEARATPAARRMATEHALVLENVQGSGPGGRVMKGDVQTAIAGAPRSGSAAARAEPPPRAEPAPGGPRPGAPAAAPAPRPRVRQAGERTETRARMTKRRQTIARRLVEAQRTAAMLTTFNEVDMTALMSLRERRKEAFKTQHGVSLGIASFFVKASLAALRAFPQLNAEIQGDEIVLKHYYDIGMAVGAEGGLVVPVVRDADTMSFAGLETAIRDFASRARDGTLTLDDLTGGTFTITNGGVFGSLLSTPILNPPQVGILGLHKIEDRAVPLDGRVGIRPMMYVALSYDHRIVDGREAVQFLVKVKELVEDPGTLLLES